MFDTKHDGRHKARLVTDLHLIDFHFSSIYSRVVSLRGIKLVLFIAELNGLDLWDAYILNACLEAFAKKKVFIKTGKAFGLLQVHDLIFNKALC